MLSLRNPRSGTIASPFVSQLANAAVDQGLAQFLLLSSLSTSQLHRAWLGSAGSLPIAPHELELTLSGDMQVCL